MFSAACIVVGTVIGVSAAIAEDYIVKPFSKTPKADKSNGSNKSNISKKKNLLSKMSNIKSKLIRKKKSNKILSNPEQLNCDTKNDKEINPDSDTMIKIFTKTHPNLELELESNKETIIGSIRSESNSGMIQQIQKEMKNNEFEFEEELELESEQDLIDQNTNKENSDEEDSGKEKIENVIEPESEQQYEQKLESYPEESIEQELYDTIIHETHDNVISFAVIGKTNSGKASFLNSILQGKYCLDKATRTSMNISKYILSSDVDKIQSETFIHQHNLDNETNSELNEDTYFIKSPITFDKKIKSYEVNFIDIPDFHPTDPKRNGLIYDWIKTNIKKFRGIFFVIDCSVDGGGLIKYESEHDYEFVKSFQTNVFVDITNLINEHNKTLNLFCILNKFDNEYDNDLINIKQTTEYVINNTALTKKHLIPFNSHVAFAYTYVINKGIENIDYKYLNEVATRELTSTWETIPIDELQTRLLDQIDKKRSMRFCHENKCGLKKLNEILTINVLDNIDRVYCDKLELIIQDKKLNPNCSDDFDKILFEFSLITSYVNSPGEYDTNSYVSSIITQRLNSLDIDDINSVEHFFVSIKKYRETITIFSDINYVCKIMDDLSVVLLDHLYLTSDNYVIVWLNLMDSIEWFVPRTRLIDILSSHYKSVQNIFFKYESINDVGTSINDLIENSSDIDCKELINNFIYYFLSIGLNDKLKNHKCSGTELTLDIPIMCIIVYEINKMFEKFNLVPDNQISDLKCVTRDINIEHIDVLSKRPKGKSIIDVTVGFIPKMLDYLKNNS